MESDRREEQEAAALTGRQAKAERAGEEELGDVDLVEAMMVDPDGVDATALALIRQQTGWDDLVLTDHAEGGAAGAATAPVTYGEKCFGHLSTACAEEATIRPWADWLGRWLALDEEHRTHRRWAYMDDLTGVGNRRFFFRFLEEALERSRVERRPVTVLVFDIDDFKQYNDRYGHEAGDEILRETVKLLTSVIRSGDRVCRIGGDEFAVVFADLEAPREPGSSHPEEIEQIAHRFQDQVAQMRFPKLGPKAKGPLTISGGLATYPWDGLTAEGLLRLADQRALQSKRRGKNVITYGPQAADRPPGQG